MTLERNITKSVFTGRDFNSTNMYGGVATPLAYLQPNLRAEPTSIMSHRMDDYDAQIGYQNNRNNIRNDYRRQHDPSETEALLPSTYLALRSNVLLHDECSYYFLFTLN